MAIRNGKLLRFLPTWYILAWLELCYHFFALDCFHPLYVAYLKKKCFAPLCLHYCLLPFSFAFVSCCQRFVDTSFPVQSKLRSPFDIKVIQVLALEGYLRSIFSLRSMITKKIFLFLLPVGAYSPSHAQSILPSVSILLHSFSRYSVENEYCFSKTLLSLCPHTYKAP